LTRAIPNVIVTAVTTYKFHSKLQVLGQFKKDWTQEQIKNEPMLFNCSVEFALKSAGPLTRAFLKAVPSEWRGDEIIIDSRVHMLMPGWYPCIPGYHHDDVARDATGQPNYDKQPYIAKHLLGLVNGEIAPTKFAVGKHSLDKVQGDTVYKVWHNVVTQQVKDGILKEISAESGKVYAFDWQTMHRGQKATGSGWRWFIRLTERRHTFTNEIRNQVNVYLDNPVAGW
jgi:hypothetical protein